MKLVGPMLCVLLVAIPGSWAGPGHRPAKPKKPTDPAAAIHNWSAKRGTHASGVADGIRDLIIEESGGSIARNHGLNIAGSTIGKALSAFNGAVSQTEAYQKAGIGGLLVDTVVNGASVAAGAAASGVPVIGVPLGIVVGGVVGDGLNTLLDYNWGSDTSPKTIRGHLADGVNSAVSGTAVEDFVGFYLGDSPVNDAYAHAAQLAGAAGSAKGQSAGSAPVGAGATGTSPGGGTLADVASALDAIGAMDAAGAAARPPPAQSIPSWGTPDPFAFADPATAHAAKPATVLPKFIEDLDALRNKPKPRRDPPRPPEPPPPPPPPAPAPPPPPTGGLQTVTVARREISIRLYDVGSVIDGDTVSVRLNGVAIASNHVLAAPPGNVIRMTLAGGINSLEIYAHNEGDVPPNTARIEISHVVDGPPDQGWSLGLGESERMQLIAPQAP